MSAPAYAELEAQAAAMREALREWCPCKDYRDCVHASKERERCTLSRAVLAPEAGKALLERLARAEAALKLGPWALHPDHDGPCLCGQCDFVRAKLAALAPVPKEGA